MALERGTGAKGDDGCRVTGAEPYDRRDFLGAVSERDRIRGMRCMVGFVSAVLFANCRCGGEAITEELAERS
jgi:hypothetical protein